ncbi:PHP domain-containing protein [Candidatus Woesearchaeota archaeon]|nr:PHP domain-containing protein [Candidatus Woesearchaeota archaeon]
MLKADFHAHCKGDPLDIFIKHTPEQLIDHAASLGYKVLAITLHTKNIYTKDLADYAKKKEIILIPGCEANIEKKHTLLLNFTQKEIDQIKTFEDLRIIKKDHHAVIAAHPFFPQRSCLFGKLEKNIDLFDGIEHCHFYTKLINFNKFANKIVIKHEKPWIGTSDTHFLWQMTGSNYTLIDAEQNIESIIKAIKKGNVKLATKPVPWKQVIKTLAAMFNPLQHIPAKKI